MTIEVTEHLVYGTRLEEFRTYIWLKLSCLVFGATAEASHLLQSNRTTVDEAVQQVYVAKRSLQRQAQWRGIPYVLRPSGITLHSSYTPSNAAQVLKTSSTLFKVWHNLSCDCRIRLPQGLRGYTRLWHNHWRTRYSVWTRTLTTRRKTDKRILSAANWTEESDLPIDDEVLAFYENDINGEYFRR